MRLIAWTRWLCGWAGAHKRQLNAPWRHVRCQCGALATPMHSMLTVWWLPPCSHLQVKSGEAGAALSATSVLGLDEQTKALLTVRTPLPLCCAAMPAVLQRLCPACAVWWRPSRGQAACPPHWPVHAGLCMLACAPLRPLLMSGPSSPPPVLAQAGILLVGVIGTVVGTQVLVDTMAARLKAGASKLATLGAFWVAVFLAAKFVLES